jgi:uncharacterized protein YqjF (DUF2071 family)
MTQTWRNVLFAHWPLAPAALQRHVPAGLELDLYAGQAWLGLVAFWIWPLTGRLPGSPLVPLLPAFNELNVRTYVTWRGQPGVLFLSLDADNALAVLGARAGAHLPYFNAVQRRTLGAQGMAFTSRRLHPSAPRAAFAARYRPVSRVALPTPGGLPHFLVERYRLFTTDRHGHLYRIEVRHPAWPLQDAQARITTNTMAQAHGIDLPPIPPLLHYSQKITAVFWPPERL